jgi:hypothetical protein
MQVLRLLVSLGAKISSKAGWCRMFKTSKMNSMDPLLQVTRGGENNYDVLHAAVYAEGKGGSSSMATWPAPCMLLNKKDEPTAHSCKI